MPLLGKRTPKAADILPQSIDAVLESPAAKTVASLLPDPARPSASTRPSWIGPKAPELAPTPGAVVMKIPVTIEFSSPGLQPPVYICTSLSDPQWEPIEMEGAKNDKGEYKFSRTFDAQEGEYQYKLRLGPGDWWICDDSKPQVDDDLGNKNNLITVKAKGQQDRVDSVHHAPLMPHESHEVPPKPHDFLTAADRHEPDDEHTSPLMSHELISPPAPHEHDVHDVHEPESSPLLKHESVAPSSQEQPQSPLFRHESIAIDNQQHDDSHSRFPLLGGRKHSNTSIPEEADPNEPGLEQFPTDHRGILDSIARTKKSLAEDETSEHPGSPAPSTSPSSFGENHSPSLPSVKEDEEPEEGKKAPLEQIPRVEISEPKDRPAAPMTPPMTPKEEEKIDQISQRLQERGKEAVETAKQAAEKVKATTNKAVDAVQETDYSSVLAGFGFALAVALTAVGLWYLKGANSLEMVEA